MNEKVESIQKYLKRKGIVATEDEIIEAAIKIAKRWGGDYTFVVEFSDREK